MAMTSSSSGADFGKLILRLALGVLVLLHGIDKVVGGPAGLVSLVEKSGLPGFAAYGVYIGEVVAPLMLIAGWWTRLAALVIAINMVVAVALVHMGDLLALSTNGGWALELQGMYLFTALALAFLGAGRFSAGGPRGRFN